MPVRPKATPTKQVQMIFASVPAASATTPAASQQMVPIETRVTTDLIVDFSFAVMEEE